MNEEEFKIKMSSEVGKAIPDLDAVGKAMADMVTNAGKAAAALGATGSAVEKASTAAKKLASTTPQLSKTFANAGGTLTSFNRIVQDAPFGFIAVGNNITDFTERFGSMVKETGSAGSALKALGGSLMGPAGVALALSAVTSGITSLVQKYGDMGTALLAVTGNLSAAQQAQLDYNDAVEKGVGKAEGEIAKITALVAVAKDESIARDQRLKAIKEVQKEYPGYLDNLSLENINSDQTAKAIDRLSSALIRKAKVQAAQERISEEFAKILAAQSKSVILQASAWDLFTAGLANAGHTQSIITAAINSGIKNQGKSIQEAENNIASFQKVLNDLLKEDAIDGVIGLGKGSGKQAKTVADILKELNQELTAVDTKAQAFGATAKDLGTDKINALKKAMEELLKIGLAPTDKLFNQLQKQGEEIQKFLQKAIGPTEPITIPVVVKPVFELPKGQITPIKGLKDKFKGELDEFTKDINKTIEASLEGVTFNVADALGQSFATGDFKSVEKAFANTLGGFMQETGKAFIKHGIQLEAFKRAIDLGSGAAAIAAGVALVAAGAAFKSSVGKDLPAFATGGITNGLTLGILGDNPGGREAIIPSQDWREAFNMFTAPGTGTLEARISGGDLLLVVKQAAREGRRF